MPVIKKPRHKVPVRTLASERCVHLTTVGVDTFAVLPTPQHGAHDESKEQRDARENDQKSTQGETHDYESNRSWSRLMSGFLEN